MNDQERKLVDLLTINRCLISFISTVDNYLLEVKQKYEFDPLQALSVLFQSNYNIEEAISEIGRIVG